ncbi:MAG TPA: Gfo/Idh/MocA family oxidoreductase [Blastocatellia bacterium]|nr:Gfo/Idh/MocA family oxidoreductase [Blastocatellia bacterium]
MTNHHEHQNGRREFVKTAGAAGGAGLLTASSYGRVLGANDRIQMAIIGAGGRGQSVMSSLNSVGKDRLEFIQVCDVYEPRQNDTLKLARAGSKATYDYREVLDNRDVVAVLNATPDHWHAQVVIDAVQAGKDVYTEKPFALSLEQGAKIVRAVRNTKQVVQVGMQRRSSEMVRAAKKLVDEGTLGEIALARAQWYWNRPVDVSKMKFRGNLDWDRFQGPAKHRHELTPPRFFHWRSYFDYNGGHMTDQGTHLMDVIQWFCNDGKPPKTAVCQGMICMQKFGEVPDTFSAVFEYPTFLATWTLSYANSYEDSWKITIQGKKATMVLDDDGFRVFPEVWKRPNIPPAPIHEFKGGIPTDPHTANFLECVRSRKEPNAPVEVGHSAVTGPHLANIAYLQKKRAVLNDDGLSAKV